MNLITKIAGLAALSTAISTSNVDATDCIVQQQITVRVPHTEMVTRNKTVYVPQVIEQQVPVRGYHLETRTIEKRVHIPDPVCCQPVAPVCSQPVAPICAPKHCDWYPGKHIINGTEEIVGHTLEKVGRIEQRIGYGLERIGSKIENHSRKNIHHMDMYIAPQGCAPIYGPVVPNQAPILAPTPIQPYKSGQQM